MRCIRRKTHFRVVAAGLLSVCLLGTLLAAQRPFRQYPGVEYPTYPLPEDLNERGEWVFARLMYRDRFECFCARIEACLDIAVASGEAVKSPLAPGNRARFGHHLAAWLAAVHLPSKPAINYKTTSEELLYQAVWFILRGMGMTDKAINTYYNPRALALFFRS